MRNITGAIVLVLALAPLAYAQETNTRETIGDKASEVKTEAVEAKREAGQEIRQAGREVKAAGREARQAVITRCADGRHTVKGASGCVGHGGVEDPR